jgi:hypothetical protein
MAPKWWTLTVVSAATFMLLGGALTNAQPVIASAGLTRARSITRRDPAASRQELNHRRAR